MRRPLRCQWLLPFKGLASEAPSTGEVSGLKWPAQSYYLPWQSPNPNSSTSITVPPSTPSYSTIMNWFPWRSIWLSTPDFLHARSKACHYTLRLVRPAEHPAICSRTLGISVDTQSATLIFSSRIVTREVKEHHFTPLKSSSFFLVLPPLSLLNLANTVLRPPWKLGILLLMPRRFQLGFVLSPALRCVGLGVEGKPKSLNQQRNYMSEKPSLWSGDNISSTDPLTAHARLLFSGKEQWSISLSGWPPKTTSHDASIHSERIKSS